MSYDKIIVGIGILIGILLFKKTKPKILLIILVGLIISFSLSFIENKLIANMSFASFSILSLIFSAYAGIKRKWLNLIIGIFALISFFSKLMHFPYGFELNLLMIVPIINYALTFRKIEKYQSEFSISTIFVAYEISEFIKVILFWIN